MEYLAATFKGLSDPTRLRVIALLADGERCVCDPMAGLDLPQSTVSRHMSFLRKSGWVTSRKKGKWVYYQLASPQNGIQRAVLDTLRAEIQAQPGVADALARLRKHLQTKNDDTCA